MTSIKLQLLDKTVDKLPSIFRIGDIIRVHRCNSNEYRNELNLTGNVNINTSWVVFSGNPDYHHGYDNSPEVMAKTQDKAFIRLLDEGMERELAEERRQEYEQMIEREQQEMMMVDNQDPTRPVSGYRKAYLDGLRAPEPKYTPISCSGWSYSFNE